MSDNSENCKANLTFSGRGPNAYNAAYASSNNLVARNLITFPVCDYNVESFYPSNTSVGVGNVVEFNCVFGAPSRFRHVVAWRNDRHEGWLRSADNLIVDPLYVNRAIRDYRLQPGSPCAGWGPR